MPKLALVTGGSGYFGNLLVRELCNNGYFVRIFDLAEPEVVPHNSKYIKGNLLDNDQLSEAVEDCELVFHTASAGMSGAGQLCQSICVKVNVEGTQLVILYSGLKSFGHFYSKVDNAGKTSET